MKVRELIRLLMEMPMDDEVEVGLESGQVLKEFTVRLVTTEGEATMPGEEEE